MVHVHWAGDPADTDALAAAAGVPRDRVVVDAAHALGTRVGPTPVGSGPAVCFSFYATKNLPVGEGGMVTTDDGDKAAWLRAARLHGMSADAWRRYLPGGGWAYDVLDAGLKANMTDVQAAIGRAQLAHLDAWQRRREAIASRYDRLLSQIPGLRLPHRPREGAGKHAWHLYPVGLGTSEDGRDAVIRALGSLGVGTSVHFIPVHRLTYFASAALRPPSGLPGADAMFSDLLSLPMYPRLSDTQVDHVVGALARVLHESRKGEDHGSI